jgi:hypothetical protein
MGATIQIDTRGSGAVDIVKTKKDVNGNTLPEEDAVYPVERGIVYRYALGDGETVMIRGKKDDNMGDQPATPDATQTKAISEAEAREEKVRADPKYAGGGGPVSGPDAERAESARQENEPAPRGPSGEPNPSTGNEAKSAAREESEALKSGQTNKIVTDKTVDSKKK